MPYIWLTAWYPTHIRDEVMKKWIESRRKFPEDPSLSETVVNVANKTTKNGLKIVNITKVKEGKLREALMLTAKTMIMFQDIEGFEYKTELYSTIEESMEALGLKMPE
ncbi:hypothetical protein ES703_30030 [subsurface metagenome]